MDRTEPLIEGLEAARTLDDLQRQVAHLRDAYRVRHAVYHSVGAGGEQYAALTYPPAWVEAYIANGYERVDPVVLACRTAYAPVDWRTLDWSSRGAVGLREQASAHGVGEQGLSIPIHGPSGKFALFTVTADLGEDAWSAFLEENGAQLVTLAHFLNRSARRIDGTAEEGRATLTPRETDALSLLALGYSRAQAAATLSISEHTLRDYIESARLKLGASNTIQAVARATTRGLLLL